MSATKKERFFKLDDSSPSQSPPLQRKVIPQHINKDIPPELQGVSVKELVKVIGESRANGNGVTPPGTPASQRRVASGSVKVPSLETFLIITDRLAVFVFPLKATSFYKRHEQFYFDQNGAALLGNSVTRKLNNISPNF